MQLLMFVVSAAVLALASGRSLFNVGRNDLNVSTSLRRASGEKLKLTLDVDLPTAWFHYDKPLDDLKTGTFHLSTPMESYTYQSSGNVNLRCVNAQYFVESMYNAREMCFALYFRSRKEENPSKPFRVISSNNTVPTPPSNNTPKGLSSNSATDSMSNEVQISKSKKVKKWSKGKW